MKQRKVGAWTLSFGLIGIGVIMLLHYMGLAALSNLKYVFPTLVILFGAEIMLERIRYPEQRIRLSVWNIVFILMVLVTVAAGHIPGISFSPGYLSPVQGQLSVDASVKRVQIDLPDSRVIVTGTTASTFSYQGELREYGATQAEANQKLKQNWKAMKDGDTLVLELERSKTVLHIGWSGPPAYLKVTLPQHLITKVHTSNGSIECTGTQGDIDLNTSNGKVQAQHISGNVSVESSNGAITAEQIDGTVKVHTSNGSITLQQINGAVNAQTSNGRIETDSQVGGNWTFHTSNGRIEMTVPSGTNAQIQADTSNGSIGGNVDWTKNGKNHGTVTLGSGQFRVTARTSNGHIDLNVPQ